MRKDEVVRVIRETMEGEFNKHRWESTARDASMLYGTAFEYFGEILHTDPGKLRAEYTHWLVARQMGHETVE